MLLINMHDAQSKFIQKKHIIHHIIVSENFMLLNFPRKTPCIFQPISISLANRSLLSIVRLLQTERKGEFTEAPANNNPNSLEEGKDNYPLLAHPILRSLFHFRFHSHDHFSPLRRTLTESWGQKVGNLSP